MERTSTSRKSPFGNGPSRSSSPASTVPDFTVPEATAPTPVTSYERSMYIRNGPLAAVVFGSRRKHSSRTSIPAIVTALVRTMGTTLSPISSMAASTP